MPQAKRNAQNTHKTLTKVSRFDSETYNTERGTVVAAFEVAPQDAAIMSLGVFTENQPTRSFLIEYYPEVDEFLIKTKITAHEAFIGGWHYLLQVANFSGKTLCAEIWEV